MLFLLDTSVVAELRKAEPHAGVVAWLKARAPEDVGLAAATAGEVQAAVERARRTNAARANALETWLDGLCSEIAILPATGAIFRLWAKLSAGRTGRSVADALVAATALHHELTVATRNAEDFAGFGVLVANPFGRAR